jgi:hypothetical protein
MLHVSHTTARHVLDGMPFVATMQGSSAPPLCHALLPLSRARLLQSGRRAPLPLHHSPPHSLGLLPHSHSQEHEHAHHGRLAELTAAVVLLPLRLLQPSHHLYQHRYPILLLTCHFSKLQCRRLWPLAWPQPPTRHAHVVRWP